MARVDVERKRKTPWPWYAGLAILALAVWGITSLLTEDADEGPAVTVPTVEDTHPPAAVPAAPDADPEQTGTEASRRIEEIAPLGEEDVGQTVRVDGQVVATGNRAFWMLTGGTVVRVDSDRRVRAGDTLSIEGTLEAADPAKTDRIASAVLARQPQSAEWQLVRVIKLVEDADSGTTALARPEA